MQVGARPVVAFQLDRHVRRGGCGVARVELTGRADLQRRHAIDRGDLQEVVDGAAGFALQQIAQVDPVAFAGLEVLDHVVAGVARFPDEGITTGTTDQGVGASTAEQDVIALATVEGVVTA
ncbi:hypothetical protein D3C86_1521230 [compost metagenome]